MITLEQVLEWKEKYGEIYRVSILNFEFIFRPIGREEYKELILEDLELGEFQELICFRSVIYPEYDFSIGLAGIAEILSDQILDVSGLHIGQAKDLLDQYRYEMMNYDYQVDCMIHEAFPEFKLEEIQGWSVRRTMYYLSRAEWILSNLKGIQFGTIDEQIQQDYEQYQQYEGQGMQYAPAEHMSPEFQEQLQQQATPPQPQQAVAQQQPQKKGELSEAEVLAMLSQSEAKNGRQINTNTNLNLDLMPELNWFKHDDELRGNFDD